MKKIITSAMILVAVAAVVTTATRAAFSDTESSNGNTFTAGTLDLNLEGGNTNVVAFTVAGMVPGGSAQTYTYDLHNAGSVSGFVDLSGISSTDAENSCNEPETGAGDVTCAAAEGELSGLLNIQLINDLDCNATLNGSDTTVYNGLVSGLSAAYDLDYPLGADRCVTAVVTWPSVANDNRGQGDALTLNLGFDLDQIAD